MAEFPTSAPQDNPYSAIKPNRAASNLTRPTKFIFRSHEPEALADYCRPKNGATQTVPPTNGPKRCHPRMDRYLPGVRCATPGYVVGLLRSHLSNAQQPQRGSTWLSVQPIQGWYDGFTCLPGVRCATPGCVVGLLRSHPNKVHQPQRGTQRATPFGRVGKPSGYPPKWV